MRKILFLALTGAVLLGSSCSRYPSYPSMNGEEIVDNKYIHKYGVMVPPEDWSQRGENGKVVSTLKNGVVVTRNYSMGTLNGETTYTFPHSETIEKMETYVEGNLKTELTYYSSGIPMKEIQYISPVFQNVTVWYETGSPQLREKYKDSFLVEAEYFNPLNQVESLVDSGNGTRINRDQYGQFLSTDTIEHGDVISKTISHADGTPKEVIPYLNHKVHGLRKTFHPGGEPHTIEEWVENKQHGLTTFYQNGEKISEISYAAGKKNGVERRYRDGTDVVEEISWKEGVKHGPAVTYVGDIQKTDWYYKGKSTSKVNYELLATQ